MDVAVTIVSILLPIGLAVFMFGIGLGLRWADFIRIKERPRPVIIGMLIQVCLLPLLAIALNEIFSLSPNLAIGLLLLAASPGGAIANIYSHLAKGDVALNVTLSSLNAAFGVIYIPIMVKVSYLLYYGEDKVIPVQFDKLVQVMVLMLIPMLLGIYLNEKKPQWAAEKIKLVNRSAMLFIIFIVVLAVANDYQTIYRALLEVGIVVFIFNVTSMLIGYASSRLMRLERRQAISITMEVGIHHCSIVIMIAMSPLLLNSIEVALPSAVYIFLMHVTAMAAVQIFKRSPT